MLFTVRCEGLVFPGAKRDSKVKLSIEDTVHVSETQPSSDSPVFPESFRFPVMGGVPVKMRLEALGGHNGSLGEVAGLVKCGRVIGGDWLATVPVRRQFELSRIGAKRGSTIVSMLFTSTAMLRPPGPGALIVTLVACKQLISADSNGLSDPYCKVSLGAQPQQRSVTRDKTLSPEFNQTFTFRVGGGGKADDYRLGITVMDQDTMTTDDDIGVITVDIGSLLGDGWMASSSSHLLALEHTKNSAKMVGGKVGAGKIQLGLRFIPEVCLRPQYDGVLNVTIVKCCNLAAADTNGLSDPYLQVCCGTYAGSD